MSSTIIIGVDSSAKPSISEWVDDRYFTSLNTNSLGSFKEKIFYYRELYYGLTKTFILAVETAYYNHKYKNWKTYGIQCENIGRIKQIGEDAGFKVVEVTPSEWQSALGCGQRAVREQLKAASIKIASAIAGREIKTDHEADAINIGGYVARRQL